MFKIKLITTLKSENPSNQSQFMTKQQKRFEPETYDWFN